MLRPRLVLVALAAAVISCGIQNIARADPLPGEILKFQQLPLTGGAPIIAPYPGPFLNTNGLPVVGGPFPQPVSPFPGHDELSTANVTSVNSANQPVAWGGTYMADDFADQFASPVVHVRWWGSYQGGQVFGGVKQFLISFESDVPASPGTTSHPGVPLLSQIVNAGALAPGSGTFTEAIVPGALPNPSDGPLFQYNAELSLPFPEQPNTVYWLKIVALVNPTTDGPINWGWHDRDYGVPDIEASVPPSVAPGENVAGFLPTGQPVWHFQDDAVSGSVIIGNNPTGSVSVAQSGFVPQHYIDGVDGPTGISQFSKDLAFELYTPAPEPASLLFLAAAGGIVAIRRQRTT